MVKESADDFKVSFEIHYYHKIMKFKITLLATLFGFLAFCSCQSRQNNDIENANWLIGTWENKTQRGSIYETWRQINYNEFSGKSYRVEGQDTIFFETIRLIQEQDSLFYLPMVKGQNNGLPVRFTIKTILENKLIFENTKHEFPQFITYTRIGTDSLVAVISGTKNGQERQQTFPMKLVK